MLDVIIYSLSLSLLEWIACFTLSLTALIPSTNPSLASCRPSEIFSVALCSSVVLDCDGGVMVVVSVSTITVVLGVALVLVLLIV